MDQRVIDRTAGRGRKAVIPFEGGCGVIGQDGFFDHLVDHLGGDAGSDHLPNGLVRERDEFAAGESAGDVVVDIEQARQRFSALGDIAGQVELWRRDGALRRLCASNRFLWGTSMKSSQ